jgi:hypothetical protein
LRNLGQKNGMTDQIVAMLKEKLQDWFSNLSDEEKAKYNGLDVNFLVDQLMYVESSESPAKKNKNTSQKEKDNKDSSKLSAIIFKIFVFFKLFSYNI